MQDSGRVDPERSALTEEKRREQLRQEAVARREAVTLRVTNVRHAIITGVAVACVGMTMFIDVAAPLPNVVAALSAGSAPGSPADVGVAVSGAS